MSEPNKVAAAIEQACKYCWSQICDLQVSIQKDWQVIEAVLKRCWAKKTIDSEHWKDLAQEEELRWQSARLVFKTFILVFVLGVIALIPKRLVGVVMPTKNSLLDGEPSQQSYAEYTPLKSYEIDNGGRKKIIEVEGDQPPPAGAYPYPNLPPIPGKIPMSVLKSTEHPTANLPATPGINAPLPVPAVPRTGLPLMPLGGRH